MLDGTDGNRYACKNIDQENWIRCANGITNCKLPGTEEYQERLPLSSYKTATAPTAAPVAFSIISRTGRHR